MDLTSPKTIKDLLSKYNARPSKGLGQNFLIDRNILEKIIKASDIKKDDIILEVGPGIGALTQELARMVHPVKSSEAGILPKAKLFNGAGKVIAIEKDATMCKILAETIKEYKNVEIINGDILRYKFPAGLYKVVSNIPYYLTSPLIRALLENKNQPSEIILMVQKEVAQRICSKPPDMSILSVSVQFYAEAKIISYVSENCFLPVPKVDSAIIKIVPFKQPALEDRERFFKVVKAGFSHPRKQLTNNLLALSSVEGINALKLRREKVESWLRKNNIKPAQRAETLSVEDWVNLANGF